MQGFPCDHVRGYLKNGSHLLLWYVTSNIAPVTLSSESKKIDSSNSTYDSLFTCFYVPYLFVFSVLSFHEFPFTCSLISDATVLLSKVILLVRFCHPCAQIPSFKGIFHSQHRALVIFRCVFRVMVGRWFGNVASQPLPQC